MFDSMQVGSGNGQRRQHIRGKETFTEAGSGSQKGLGG